MTHSLTRWGLRAAAPSLPAQPWRCPRGNRLWRLHVVPAKQGAAHPILQGPAAPIPALNELALTLLALLLAGSAAQSLIPIK